MILKDFIKEKLPQWALPVFQNIYRFFLKVFFIVFIYNSQQKRYKEIEKKIKFITSKQQKIRIGFYIIYDASWGARPLFEKMQKDSCFEVKILVCPDISRGIENQTQLLQTVYNRLVGIYGEQYVINSYDEKKGFVDYSDYFDIIGLANPYDSMTYKYYGVKYLSLEKKKLCFFNSYGYQGKLKYDINLMKLDSYNLFWKFFVDNKPTYTIAKKYQYIHGKNIIISGSCKMDKFSQHIYFEKKRKTILIAPHHTVRNTKNGLNLSNFLRFSELIQSLPKKYPEIDFIFRPHPLLFITLKNEDLWGKEKVNKYLDKLLENNNLEYSTDGEYFDVFNKSDAMIDDCGSFLAEYFYTGKPQCYVLQNNKQFNREFINFGKRFFHYIYKAYSEDDIYNFIENIVINDNDSLKIERDYFAKNEVMINYPNVSTFIINYFKDEFLSNNITK